MNGRRIELATMNHHYMFYDLDVFFENASKLGYPCVELWTSPQHFFMDYQQNDPTERVLALMDKFGVRVHGICPEQCNPKPHNMAAKDKSIQNRTLAYFTRAIDVAKTLGASQVLVTSGWAYYDEPVEQARERSASMLKKVAHYAESQGINLAIEALRAPESRIANTVKDLELLLEMVDETALKVCLDIGAMVSAGDTIQGYFDAFGANLIHSHYVDTGERSLHLALGDGNRNIAEDIMTFERNGYTGVLSVECTDSEALTNPMAADARSMSAYLEAYRSIEGIEAAGSR